MDGLELIIIIGGSVIMILLTVIGFFLARLVGSVQTNSEHIGRNKGNIELVKQQQQNDVLRIEETTQQEIRHMAQNVGELSKSVNTLVTALAKKGIENTDGES